MIERIFFKFMTQLTLNSPGNTLYMFEDDLVWIFENSTSRPHYPVAISEVFPGIEGPITAAMSGTHNKVYFFR